MMRMEANLNKKNTPAFFLNRKKTVPSNISLIYLLAFLITTLISCQAGKGAITASGTIEATEVTVSAKVSGEIVTANVNEGAILRKGDVIVTIDSSTLLLRKQQADAGVALAEASFALLLKGARIEDIKQVEDQLVQVRENYNQAKADADRTSKLYDAGSVTKKQFDDSKTKLAVLQAQLGAAQAALGKVKNLARPEDIEIAQAQLEQAKIASKLLDKQVADCTVTAPIDGTVTNKLVEAGEFVGTGSPIAVLSNLTSVSVTIYVSEAELGRIRIGGNASVSIDTFPGRSFPGKVSYISPVAEFTPKNIQTKEERIKQVFGVKIELQNPDGELKSGIPADAMIPLQDVKDSAK
jgi:HlyD family secretion protein